MIRIPLYRAGYAVEGYFRLWDTIREERSEGTV